MKPHVKSAGPVRRLFGSGTFLLILAFILLFLLFHFGRAFVRSAAIRQEIVATEAEKIRLESQNQTLSEYQDYLSTSTFLEKEAREKFGQQRSGESTVYIPEDGGLEFTADEGDTTESLSRFQEWWQYFFPPNAS